MEQICNHKIGEVLSFT